ncbi:MAG: peptidoglycan D,D-transpeptidase FtsI family protein [Candidatus Coprovivens sp.]
MFQKIKQKRIKIVLLVTILVLFVILFKIFYLQTISNNKLSKLANDLWERNLPLTPDRGRILDRNGKVLATNITTTTLYAVPNQIVDKELTAKALSSILNCSYDSILKHLTKKTSLEKINPEGRQLSSDIADKIAALNIDGLYLMKESVRYYPYDTVLSHVLGYVGIDNQGLSGLELQYDKYLTGTSGSIKYFSDGKGHRLNELEKYVPAVNGMDITLTIDIDIQLALENELSQVDTKYTPEESLAIVMDPNTGEILAMASRPTFDSNNYQKFDLETINRNLPIWKSYEPGSTFKNVNTI